MSKLLQNLGALIFLSILTTTLAVTFTVALGLLKQTDPRLECVLEGRTDMIPAPYGGIKDIKGKLVCLKYEFYLFEEIKNEK